MALAGMITNLGGGVSTQPPAAPARAPGPGERSQPPLKQPLLSAAEFQDCYPPIRQGAALAAADGKLWILPATSAQSRAGELVFDIVNGTGLLVERVRLPVGRSNSGFGKSARGI